MPTLKILLPVAEELSDTVFEHGLNSAHHKVLSELIFTLQSQVGLVDESRLYLVLGRSLSSPIPLLLLLLDPLGQVSY